MCRIQDRLNIYLRFISDYTSRNSLHIESIRCFIFLVQSLSEMKICTLCWKNVLNHQSMSKITIKECMFWHFFADDLKTVVNKIDLLFVNQRNDYLIAFDEVKMRFSQKLRQSIFRDLCEFVILFALKKINQEYKAMTKAHTALPACTKSYNTKLDLLCKHMIQNRLFTSSNVISLKDVHSHWRFFKKVSTVNRENQDANDFSATNDDDFSNTDDDDSSNINVNSLLLIQNSAVCRSKDKPSEALNKNRSKQAFEIFTQRELSQFEHVQKKINQKNASEQKAFDQIVQQQTTSSSKRERGRERERERKRKRADRRRDERGFRDVI